MSKLAWAKNWSAEKKPTKTKTKSCCNFFISIILLYINTIVVWKEIKLKIFIWQCKCNLYSIQVENKNNCYKHAIKSESHNKLFSVVVLPKALISISLNKNVQRNEKSTNDGINYLNLPLKSLQYYYSIQFSIHIYMLE